MPETAKRTARVPILGENGRISDDYIPAAIGENVTKAESAATRAETAATSAEDSASAASTSAAQASGSTTAGGAATSAQSAQTAAEAAQSAAAGSAQDAQQSATAAAESAASVANKFISSAQATTLDPGSPATASVADQVLTIGVPKGDKGDKGEKGDTGTGVPDGGEPGQLLSKTDSGTAWVDPPSGNVLTGEATGYVAHAEDAYAQKPIEVRVKGRTVKNLWAAINATVKGVTVSTDETGLITASGTPTSDVYLTNGQNIAVTPGASMSYMVTNVELFNYQSRPYVQFFDADGSLSSTTPLHVGNSLTVPDGASEARCYIAVYPSKPVNGSFRVMLVEGDEAPDCFTPTGLHSVEPTNLVTAGKNLFDGEFPPPTNTVSLGVLPPGSYTVSMLSNEAWWQTASNGNSIFFYESNLPSMTMQNTVVGQRCYGTFTNPVMQEVALTDYSDGIWEKCSDFQLELGSTATAYEPPNVTETPLPEVELRGLPNGTCDELVIAQDGTATVERRTQLSGGEVTALPEPTTEKLSAVSLPKLPAQTFNAYHDSNVPSDTTVTYERDINIAFEQLAKQVAGTASAVAVREASTIEEE